MIIQRISGAVAALAAGLMLAGPAAGNTAAGAGPDYKPQKYYWHEDCEDSPGNNLKCVKVRQMIVMTGNYDMDKIYVRLGDDNKNWCGADRISGAGSWGINYFQWGVNEGHTPTITRYYVLPAGCQYRFHFRHYYSTVGGNDTFNISIDADDDVCFQYDLDKYYDTDDEPVTIQNCPRQWPGDTTHPNYSVPLD